MPQEKIKAIFFDFGETLLNYGRVDVKALFLEGAKLSYEYLQSNNQPVGNFKLYCLRNFFAIRIKYFLSRITGHDFDSLELLKKVNGGKGNTLDEQQWRQLAWLWYEPLGKCAKAESDFAETLAKLKQMNLKLGIVSNTFITASVLERHLKEFGVLDFFTVRMFSYQFKFRKPDGRIFQAAAEKIGEKSENIMFVGDRIDKDVRPALKAGMIAVLKDAYTNLEKPTPKGAHRISALCELPALVEAINDRGD